MMVPHLIEETQLSLQLGMSRDKEGGNKPLRWPRKEENHLFGQSGFVGRVLMAMMRMILMFENEIMIDKEQPVLEAQTSKAVEELKSALQYQGKGAMQKRVTALQELRRLLSKSEFPPMELRSALVQYLCLCSVFPLALPTSSYLSQLGVLQTLLLENLKKLKLYCLRCRCSLHTLEKRALRRWLSSVPGQLVMLRVKEKI